MTKLERQLAETFRAARWEESHGRPVCPSCYDHQSVIADKQPRSGPPGLSTYFCRDCRTRLSDVSGTILAGTWRPLLEWALTLLMTDIPANWREFGRSLGRNSQELRRIRRRWDGTKLGPAWTRRLHEAGITFETLAQSARAGAPPSRKERATC